MSISHQGYLSSLQRKIKNGNLANKNGKMVINPAPSNFLSRQKLDDYLLEILSEAGKDEIFSYR